MQPKSKRRQFLKTAVGAGLLAVNADSAFASQEDPEGANGSNSMKSLQTNNHERGVGYQPPKEDLKSAKVAAQDVVGALDPTALKVGQAESPFQRDASTWNTIVERLRTNYKITAERSGPDVSHVNDLGSPFEPKFLAIDYNFRYTAETTDSDFRFNHADILLDQAADLLDRGIRDRTDWYDLAVRSFNVASELTEYYALDAIHQKEIEKGFYTVEAKQSNAALRSESALINGNRIATTYVEWLIKNKYSEEEMTRQCNIAQLAAFLSPLAAYELPAQGGLVKHIWDGVEKTIPEHLKDAAFAQVWHSLIGQQVGLLAQQQEMNSNLEASVRKTSGLEAKSEWDRSDVEFKRSRTKVARDLADLKMRAFTEPGGALNYEERMRPLKERFYRDFRDALARVKAAHQGMTLLFGFDRPLPSSIQSLLNEAPSPTNRYFDDCLIWVRDAISWLVRFTQLDQNYVLPISVRTLINNNAVWEAGRAAGSWQIQLPETLFPNQRHIRLRGLSASVKVDSDDAEDLWQVMVSVPRSAYCKHISGTNLSLDQTKIPPCRLSRVKRRDDIREPDVVGAMALHNASPLGIGGEPNWRISMNTTSLQGTQISKVKDVYLDLHLAVRHI